MVICLFENLASLDSEVLKDGVQVNVTVVIK